MHFLVLIFVCLRIAGLDQFCSSLIVRFKLFSFLPVLRNFKLNFEYNANAIALRPECYPPPSSLARGLFHASSPASIANSVWTSLHRGCIRPRPCATNRPSAVAAFFKYLLPVLQKRDPTPPRARLTLSKNGSQDARPLTLWTRGWRAWRICCAGSRTTSIC